MKKNTLYTFLLIFLVAFLPKEYCFAQPGKLDLSFNINNGFDLPVSCSHIQQDGKILLGGVFSSYNGVFANKVIRIYNDGSIDTTFNAGSGQTTSYIRNIGVQTDGKIIVVGDFTSFNGVVKNRIVRLNTDGTIDNSFDIGTGANNPIYFLKILDNDKILIGGVYTSFNNNSSIKYITRLNPNGSIDSSFINGIGPNNAVSSISIQDDNKIIIGGWFTNVNGIARNRIARLEPNGELDLSFNPGSGFSGAGSFTRIQTTAIQVDGKILAGGEFTSYNSMSVNRIVRLNPDGTRDNSFNFNTSGADNTVLKILLQSDNKIIVTGVFNSYNSQLTNRITRLNSDGSFDPFFLRPTGCNSIIGSVNLDSDNKILITGEFTSYDGVDVNYIARLQGDSYIKGKLFLDLNENCTQETNENILNQNFTISIQPGNYTVQAQNGVWFLDSLPAGTYTATIDTTNTNFTLTCPSSQTFTVVHTDSTTVAPSFGFVANNPCPAPNVSISMPRMRRGFGGQKIYVEACNQQTATDTIADAYVEVQLDENISVQSASLPYTDLGNNLYKVQVGTLFPMQCVNFNFTTTVELSAIANQTLCLEAELFPQPSCVFDTTFNPYLTSGFTPCELPWDSSSLQINKNCSNDSVFFTITNVGSVNMECYSPVRIFIDSSLVYEDSILLNSQEDFTYSFPSDGATYRLEVDQHPLHPGISYPNASLELCGSGNWTPGIIGTMPQNDADPIIDIFCDQVSAPYDPNDKTGFPIGIGEINKIRNNQSIEYLIRFQNIGTDTAVNVVIQDTLSEDFNIFTVQSGVSSYPYEFSIKGQRLLEWRFNNIMLPDSLSDPEGSNGFVTFKVNQVSDLPLGTVLENTAYIYFDFEEAVITNTYTHTIGDFNLLQTCYGDYELVDANFVACDSAEINGNMYYASQIIVDTIPNQFFCGKIQTTNLVINSTVTQNENIIACDSAEINSTWYYTSQEVINTYQTLEGCDSVVVTNLVINLSVIQNQTLSACDSLEFDGTWYYTSQEINNIYQTTEGCDSVVNIVINIESPGVNIVQIANNLQVASGFTAYEWSFENTVIEGANSNTLQPNLDGEYAVKVTDSNGCIEVATFNYVRTNLTDNNLQEYIKIYPNPSQGVFMVEFINNIEPFNISVFDVSGRIIENTMVNESNYELNLTNQATGIYFINISNNNYNFVDKLVKN